METAAPHPAVHPKDVQPPSMIGLGSSIKIITKQKRTEGQPTHIEPNSKLLSASVKRVVEASKKQRDNILTAKEKEPMKGGNDKTVVAAKGSQKQDDLLSQFDQFVVDGEMEKTKKVVEASKKQRKNILTANDKELLKEGCNIKETVAAKGSQKQDDLRSQFDQFVVYGEMEKQKKRALEQQSPHALKDTHIEVLRIVTGDLESMKEKVAGGEKQNTEKPDELHLIINPLEQVNSDNSCEMEALACLDTSVFALDSVMGALITHEDQEKHNEQPTISNDGDDSTKIASDDDDEDDEDDDIESKDEEEISFMPTREELSEERKPEIGMHFNTIEAAHRFVNVYGYIHGFSVFKGRNYRNKEITPTCCKSRKTHDPQKPNRKRKRSVLQRTNCPMNVVVKLMHGQWEFIAVSLDHNHDLLNSPSLTKFFANHRSMSEDDKNMSTILQDCRVPPRRIMSIFRRLKGSRKVLSFNKKKIENLRRQNKREKNTDIAHALKFVEKLQAKNQGIVYKMATDGNTMRSILWTDARSQMDYELYGDFISFDTTFSTNKYNMPFAPFIGINGHGRTIVFAWALLKDETAETFRCAMETFLEVMNGKKPQIIMTDQCAAMKNAIDELLFALWHRFCLWHILNNCSDKMGGYMAVREGMDVELRHIIMDSLTVEEFESAWEAMIVKYNVVDNTRLPLMWKWRKHWVPVYFKKVFCPFIRTTGRSEGMNSIYKDYVKRRDTIETFLVQYDLFQETIIEAENEDRFCLNQGEPIYWGHNRIERHAGKIYTRGIFFKFQIELQNSTAFVVETVELDKIYNLRRTFNYKKQEYHRDVFQVQVDRSKDEFECVCAKFYRDGILCCHVLRLFTQFDIIHIPERYINKRWTKEYREVELLKHKQRLIDAGTGSDASQVAMRYALVLSKVTEVCTKVSKDDDRAKEFLEDIQKLQEKYAARHRNQPQQGDDNQQEPLKDPPIRVSKSVDKGQRLKKQSEKNSKKKTKKMNEKQQNSS